MSSTSVVCKDCVAEGNTNSRRPARNPGPRCTTHWRAELRRRKREAHGRMVERTYGINEELYEKLYEYQEGHCALCHHTGKSKRLAVDHDHDTGEIRGLLCGPCNKLLGRIRDNVQYFANGIHYLACPPARGVLNGPRTVPSVPAA